MQKRLLAAAAVAIVGSTSAIAAHAGYRYNYPIVVSLAGRYAYGALGSVRASSDANSYIGCSLNSAGAIYCQAADATASQVPSCSVASPTALMQSTVASIKGDSYLYFTWDSNWQCTYIYVDNDSQYLPKPQ
jgi:hypothetical protein